jgi:hypothetical protein
MNKILSHKELSLKEKIKLADRIAGTLKMQESGVKVQPQITSIKKIVARLKKNSGDIKKLQEEIKIKSTELKESELELDCIINRFSESQLM